MHTAYIVDDESLFLRAFAGRREFAENGFRVIGSSSVPGRAAEEICALRPAVVFTDMRMPGMTGVELMRQVRAVRPDTLFVVASAYNDYDYLRQALRQEAFDYLIKPISADALSECLQSIHARLRTDSEEAAPPADNETFANALRYLRENLNEPHSLTLVAERFGVSPGTLGGYFSRYLNTSFTAWLTECRMKNAKALLTGTLSPLKEIARRCGYEDYFYFCRVFQKFYKKTPSEVRQEGRGEG